MPTKAKFFEYEGLSGETYPDRMAGGVEGIYKVAGLPVSPYLVPQECGMHMETKWVELTRNQTLDNTDKDQEDFSLRFEQQDTPFAFSALPFKAEELEQATHIEELPPERRTVLTIFAKVRGVGVSIAGERMLSHLTESAAKRTMKSALLFSSNL